MEQFQDFLSSGQPTHCLFFLFIKKGSEWGKISEWRYAIYIPTGHAIFSVESMEKEIQAVGTEITSYYGLSHSSGNSENDYFWTLKVSL